MKKILPTILLLITFQIIWADQCTSWLSCYNQYKKANNNYEKIHSLKKSIQLWKKTDGKNNLDWSINTLAHIYYKKGMKLNKIYWKTKNKKFLHQTIIPYRKSIKIKSTPHCIYYLALAYSSLKKNKDAIKVFKEGIAKHPESLYLYSGITLIYTRKKEWSLANKFTTKGIRETINQINTSTSLKKNKSLNRSLANSYGSKVKFLYTMTFYNKALVSTKEAYNLNPDTDNYNLAAYGFKSAAMLGNKYLAYKDYDRALYYYNLAQAYGKKNKTAKKQTILSSGWSHWIELIKKRKRLGIIRPEFIHKVLTIHIKKINSDFISTKNKKIKVKSTLPNNYKETIKTNELVMTRIYEALSNGKYSITFKSVDIDAVIIKFSTNWWKYGNRELRYPIHESIKPFAPMRKIILKNINEVDSIFIYWNGSRLATAAGGGGKSFPIIPYQLYSPIRGWISMPIGYKWYDYSPEWGSSMGFIHEFFHVIQGMTCRYRNLCIGKSHEYLPHNKKNVIGWNGSTEMNYYIWRSNITLQKVGWKNLNYRLHYPSKIDSITLKRNLSVVKNISLIKRKKSWDLSTRASKLWKKNKLLSLNLYKQSLQLNPYNHKSLRAMAGYYNNNKKYKHSENYYNRLLYLLPNDKWINYRAALVYRNLKKHKKELMYFNKSIEIDSKFSWGYYNGAFSYKQLKQYKKAVQYLSKVISLKPQFSWAYLHRGLIYYYHLNKKKLGLNDIKKALRLGNSYAKGHYKRMKK